jgi:hypothetical protein
MASGRRIVFVFDDIIQRPLGTYGHLGLLKVLRGYVLGLGDLPKRPGYVAIELRRGSSWKLSGKSPGKGSGKGSRERSEHKGKAQPNRQSWLGERERWWYSIHYLPSSHSLISLTPLLSIFCSPSKLTSKTSQISFLPQMTLTTSSG